MFPGKRACNIYRSHKFPSDIDTAQ